MFSLSKNRGFVRPARILSALSGASLRPRNLLPKAEVAKCRLAEMLPPGLRLCGVHRRPVVPGLLGGGSCAGQSSALVCWPWAGALAPASGTSWAGQGSTGCAQGPEDPGDRTCQGLGELETR